MARKFITSRELDMIDTWNKELIQDTVQQEVLYYAISYDDSVVDDLYDESVEKAYAPPVRLNARVEFEQLATTAGGGHLDSNYSLSVMCHADELNDRDIKPREGDFVEYGRLFFEVSSVATTQPVFGQINDRLMVKLTCVPSRESQFKADGSTPHGVDNSHQVVAARPRTLGDKL